MRQSKKLQSLEDTSKEVEAYMKNRGLGVSHEAFKASGLPIGRTTFYSLKRGKNCLTAKKLTQLYEALGYKIKVHLFIEKLPQNENSI